LYRHTCPYLDGLSTTWVLEEYRRAGDVYQEHLRIIDDLYDDLKARMTGSAFWNGRMRK
jgi:hypothetical protein